MSYELLSEKKKRVEKNEEKVPKRMQNDKSQDVSSDLLFTSFFCIMETQLLARISLFPACLFIFYCLKTLKIHNQEWMCCENSFWLPRLYAAFHTQKKFNVGLEPENYVLYVFIFYTFIYYQKLYFMRRKGNGSL